MELEHHDIETNRIHLHVVEAGPKSGIPVVLLHGFPEFWYGWRKQITAVVNAGCRVIVPDQRGDNRSDKPKGMKNYRADELTQDILGSIPPPDHPNATLVDRVLARMLAPVLAHHHPDRLL